MKFVPRDLPPKPERTASPSTTTTRYLRLKPAPDVIPAVAPEMPAEPAPGARPPDSTALASPGKATPLPSELAGETHPFSDSPEPVSQVGENSPALPIRPPSKRIPNVFASAPSSMWPASSGVTSSQLLRRIPVSEIGAPVARPAPEPVTITPEVTPPVSPEEIAAEESAEEPEILPEIEGTTLPVMTEPEPQPVSTLPATAAVSLRQPPVGRLSPATPLSRLTGAQRSSLGQGFWILLVVLIIALILLIYFFGLAPRVAAGQELDREQKFSAQRIIVYGVARLATPKVELPLPGTIEAFQQASLYARTNGYVKKWLVDIGDVVQQGQLLAELDTPEVDQQLTQAKASADQAKASLDIAQSAADRWNTMAKAHAVSQEDADEKNATNNEAHANFNAAQANVARLTDLENFKEIRAPFAGKITYRNIDVGSLISAGPGATNSELFRVAQTDPLRVYVEVPESDAPSIKPGVQATIEVTSYPGRDFHGEVVRDSGALSTTSRTLRTEVHVVNPEGALLPGAFAEVRLLLFDTGPAVLIPASTLIVNGAGTSVAMVITDKGRDTVHYTPVRVGRDFGTEVEILNNVREGDRLVTNPAADLNDGSTVTARPLEQTIPPTPISRTPTAPKA